MIDKKLLKEVLGKITPSNVNKKAVSFVESKLKENLKNNNIDAKVFIGGSYAKGTYLGKDFDCDVFVRFNFNKYLKKDISKELKKCLTGFKFETVHGSRDYFQFIYKEINFEIVPLLNISNAKDAVNVMDMSPLHVTWVKNKLKDPKLKGDIRLLKQFLKAGRVYGAESYIKGFSGHVVDILIMYYGGFEKTLKALISWKKQIVIDIEKHYKGKDAMFYLNSSKTRSPIIVIDPILPERNAAAALDTKILKETISLAKKFLKKPDKKYFQEIKLTPELISKKHAKKGTLITLNLKTAKGKLDASGGKLVKSLEWINRLLEDNGFSVSYSNFEWDKKVGGDAQLFFVIKKENIEKFYLGKGPELEMKKAITEFKKCHKGKTFVKKEDRIYVKIKRKYSNVNDFFKKAVLKDEYILKRVNNFELFKK